MTNKHKYTTSAMMERNLKNHHLKLFIAQIISRSTIAAIILCVALAIIF